MLFISMAIIGGISRASTPLLCIGSSPNNDCQKSFPNVIEAQQFLERTLQIEQMTIQQSLPYTLIYNLLEQGCNEQVIEESKKLTTLLQSMWTNSFREPFIKSEMERRFTLLQHLIAKVKTSDEKLFCKQKYLMYHLLERSQVLFTTPSLAVREVALLLPQGLPSTPLSQEHAVASVTSGNTTYLTLLTTNSLTTKTALLLSQLTEKYLQTEIGKLIALGFLTAKDVQTLDQKIEITYVTGCGTTRGSYHMIQKTDGSQRKFKMIKLNVNLCDEAYYIKNFDRYVRQIFIHELGHYLYYFKDISTVNFDTLCRQEGENICQDEDFVSAYAQKNKEEDYAESFAHRYIGKTTEHEMIVDREHGSAPSSAIKQQKESYFEKVWKT